MFKKSSFNKSNSFKKKNTSSNNNYNSSNKTINKNNTNNDTNKIKNKFNNKKENYFNKRNKKDNFKKSKTNSYQENNSKQSQFFRTRYNDLFGKETFNKLLITKRELSNNQFIRINLSKTTITEIEDFLKKNRVKYSKTFIKNCLKIEKSFFNISSSLPSLTSKIYIQDLASQIPVNTIDFKKIIMEFKNKNRTLNVLDMAASPGSKTTQIADLLTYNKINYKITALEINQVRINRLINNIQKHGFENINIINIAAEKYQSNQKYDLILLDAPCSGNLIDDKEWLSKRNMQGIEQNASLQKKLIQNAYNLLEKDGQLIYSTCSLEPEENELNINWALNKTKLKILDINLQNNKNENNFMQFNFNIKPILSYKNQQLNSNISKSIRIMPFHSKTQGFFITNFTK